MNMRQLTPAEQNLIKLDTVLGELIVRQGSVRRQSRGGYFESLCRSIIGQQVSVASASAIYTRFRDITKLQPKLVLELQANQIKEIGLSRQKHAYLTDLAGHFVNNPNVYNHLDEASDEEVIAELTKVKGIGEWTAQMFLMFTLDRPDVFAPADVGLQKAMIRLYGWNSLPSLTELNKIAKRWSPYRTTACWHLWESIKTKL